MSALDDYYRNVRNLEYMPRSKYLLNPPTVEELEEEDEVVDTPATVSPVVPTRNIGSVGGITSLPANQLMGDFTTAVQNRQKNLENPGFFAQKLYDFGFPRQRSVDQMMRDATAFNMAQLGPDFSQIGITSNMTGPEIRQAMAEYAADETSIGNYPAVNPRDVRTTFGIPTLSNILNTVLPNSYYDMNVPEQIYTQSKMGYRGPTIFGANDSGLQKDIFGRNIVSAFGNYSEKQKKDVAKLDDYFSSEKFKDKYGDVELEEDDDGNYYFSGVQEKYKGTRLDPNFMNKLNLTRYSSDKKDLKQLDKIYEETGYKDVKDAEIKDLQRRIDRGDFGGGQGDPPDRDLGNVTEESAAQTSGVGGGGYTQADTARESRRGGQYGFKKGGLAGILGF